MKSNYNSRAHGVAESSGLSYSAYDSNRLTQNNQPHDVTAISPMAAETNGLLQVAHLSRFDRSDWQRMDKSGRRPGLEARGMGKGRSVG